MKIGVVGTGMIACEVLPLLSGTGWELSAICGTERSAAKLSQLGEKYGALTYTDYSAFLKSGEFDSVYLAVPNDLHFEFASRALSAGKHVIAEKPLAACYAEAASLASLAAEKKLFLIEAISNVHTENYAKLKELLPLIGGIKHVNITFARKSSRFDAFLAGETPPVFDPARCGGALMDIGIYNLHWLLGLFGEPESATYSAKISRGIDTSGTATLSYGGFTAVSVAAKDCTSLSGAVIEGENGTITQAGTPNESGPVTLALCGKEPVSFDYSEISRLVPEFRYYRSIIEGRQTDLAAAYLEASLKVSRLMTRLRLSAGVAFPCD